MKEAPDQAPRPSPWGGVPPRMRERNNRRINVVTGVAGLGAAALTPFISDPESTKELILICGITLANSAGGSYLLCDALGSKVLENISKKRGE